MVSQPEEPASAGTRPQRLSALDTTFLRMEGPDLPMHLGGFLTLDGSKLRRPDGALDIERARRHIEARLDRIPRFTRRLSEVPLDIGRPLWVDDESFDISRHVRLASVPAPGGRAELLSVVAMLHEVPLDRRHPLWELWLLDGLEGGEIALVEKAHHALVDGISGVELIAAILDLEPDDRGDAPSPRTPTPGPGPIRRVRDAVTERVLDPVTLAGATLRGIRATPLRAAHAVRHGVATIRELASSGVATTPSTFRARVDRSRDLHAIDLGLDDVKAVGHALDATVNDVILAVVAGAVRRWMVDRGIDPEDIHTMVPVSTRSGPQAEQAGNRVGSLLVTLPVTEADPRRRLEEVTARVNRAKQAHEGEVTSDLFGALDHLPALGLRTASLLAGAQPFANLVVTNVPGPQQPLYFLGAEAKEMVPIVPLAAGLAVGIAILSYCDRISVAVMGNPSTCDGLGDLTDALDAEFADLAGELLPD